MSQSEMTSLSFLRKVKLLKEWDFICVVCGHKFDNMACVTVEHVIPRSVCKNRNKHTNCAPSHWRCNTIKGSFLPLSVASKTIDHMKQRLGEEKFKSWLNEEVPNRTTPANAKLSIDVIIAKFINLQA